MTSHHPLTTLRAARRPGRRGRQGGPGWPRPTRYLVALATVALGLAACSGGGGSAPTTTSSAGAASTSSSTGATTGTTGSSTSPKGATLTVADLAPFTGTDAALGPTYLAACYAATGAINHAGGVLGHQLACKSVDTRGDPADAVPATRQMFASTPNLVMVIGVTSDEAASVVPIINHNKMVVFAMTGQSEFDHTHFQYFYRLVPPDIEEGYALVSIAHYYKHYNKIALAFGNDIGSQAFVQPVLSAIKKAGETVAGNETLNLQATTFRTEASKIIASHPDVILTEALGPTDATFLSEVKQLNGGHMIPVIGTSATISPAWYKSVSAAVGASTLSQNFLADNLVVLSSGPAYSVFKANLLAVKSKFKNAGNFNTYLTAPGSVHLYDGINLGALAMLEAKSTNPVKYQPFIIPIANGTSGAVVVHSFQEGVAALEAGKAIRYEGPGGPVTFDSYHTSNGIFQVDTYSPSGQVHVVANIPNAHLRALS